MVRLKDIAQKAGVSIMTISKALRDAPDVSPATKTRIKLLAQQMGYVPDSSAQGLRTRSTKLFGVVLPSCADPFYGRVVLALEERAYELGYDLLVTQSVNIPEREEACIRRCLARRVDGLFIIPAFRPAGDARMFLEIVARQVPAVLLEHPLPHCAQFTCVHTDDLLAGYSAAQHLIKLGHRRIAFLAGTPGAPWAQERFEGYRRALRETGQDVDDRLVFLAGRSIEDGEKATLQLLSEKCAITAVQAANDLVAVGCSQILAHQGIRIPQDVSVMGFGNIGLSEFCRVPLTTMGQPKYRLGEAAIGLMQQMLKGQPAENKRLPAELIPRASTGIPSATSYLK
jgi:LacI family repressor for deo operon, udp, cdd, tsx, nupC, and nupG